MQQSIPALRRFSPTRLILLVITAALLILVPTWLILASNSAFDSPAVHNALWAPGGVERGGPAAARAALHQYKDALNDSEFDAPSAVTKNTNLEHDKVIMPKFKNETAKAELGRASWKLLHTMAARFPDEPTENERETFRSWLFLFSRLYPCGECAAEFQALLQRYPPQVGSRQTASIYLCFLHNQVNARLGKPEFDCSANLEGIYDCGCGPEELDASEVPHRKADHWDPKKKRDPVTGAELVGG